MVQQISCLISIIALGVNYIQTILSTVNLYDPTSLCHTKAEIAKINKAKNLYIVTKYAHYPYKRSNLKVKAETPPVCL